MKKKFSFVLLIVLLISMLSLVLVACDPKDPESFSAVDSMTTLQEIWDAWAIENLNTITDTLGIDVNVNLKSNDKDINFILQGGISSNANVKEGLRLAIVNNLANKNIAEIISNSDGTFIGIDGFTDKPLKINDVKFQGVGEMISNSGLGLTIGDIASILKLPIINLINDAINHDGGIITIKPVLNGKNLYDVNYTFSFKLNSMIDGILGFIPGSEEIFDEIKAELDGISINFEINTTGNQRTKVAKPAKNAPKYNYNGGKLTGLKLIVKDGGSEMTINGGANGIKLLNTMPNIISPTESIDFDTFVLPSNLNGTFNLKNNNGELLGKYEYTANFDFDKTQLVSTMIECATEQSAIPFIDKLFKDKNGKIYIEIKHICDSTCKINHLSNDTRPLMTIAYDPNSFGTNRVYMAFNLRGMLADNFGDKMLELLPNDTAITSQDILDILPKEDLIYSIDPSAYLEWAEVLNANEIVMPAISAISDNNNSINFAQIVDNILQIDSIGQNKETIRKIIDIIFPNVYSIDYTLTHTNEHITNWDIKAKFVENREFVYSEIDSIEEIIAPINSKITYTLNSQNIVQIATNKDIYNQDGTLKSLSEEDIYELIGATVEGQYIDILGNSITENMTILDIVGLDLFNIESTQTIYLVVGGVTGSNVYKFMDDFNNIFGTTDKKAIDYEYPVSGIIELNIKLAN